MDLEKLRNLPKMSARKHWSWDLNPVYSRKQFQPQSPHSESPPAPSAATEAGSPLDLQGSPLEAKEAEWSFENESH